MNVATNATISLPLVSTGLNGFTGNIALGTQFQQLGSNCFAVASMPSSMPANSQVTVTVQNMNCPVGASAFFFVHGSAVGVRRVASNDSVSLNATAAGDFTVGVGVSTPAVLGPQSCVNYPVTVRSVNGQTGYVSLSVTGLPSGVTYSLSPTQVYLSGYGSSATNALVVYSSSSMPSGGTYQAAVMGTLASNSHNAVFSLSTLVTAFQVTSATGSGIVHNDGQEVQITQNVPAGNAPPVATCTSPDPEVTCRVISSSSNAVVLGVTASTSAIHGTRCFPLNGGALTTQMAVGDQFGGLGLPNITVQAGQDAYVEFNLPQYPCPDDGPCASASAVGGEAWINGSAEAGMMFISADPPPDASTDTTYSYYLTLVQNRFDFRVSKRKALL